MPRTTCGALDIAALSLTPNDQANRRAAQTLAKLKARAGPSG